MDTKAKKSADIANRYISPYERTMQLFGSVDAAKRKEKSSEFSVNVTKIPLYTKSFRFLTKCRIVV